MSKKNYKSAFDFVLTIMDCDGNDIGFPSFDWIARFYTKSGMGTYIVSSKGGVYTNCFNDAGKIHCVFKGHKLGTGELLVEFVALLPNVMYKDGIQDVYTPLPTGIELVRGMGDCGGSLEVSLTIPFVYITAYELAVANGYKGTLEQYISYINQFPQMFQTVKDISIRLPKVENSISSMGAKVNANDFLTRGERNMNNALETGVYPWCLLGRPAGSKGAYTLIVRKSSDADNQGFYSIEQTAYGRQDELGQVWQRVIFRKNDGSDTQYGEWIRLDNEVTESGIYRCPGAFEDLVRNMSAEAITSVLGECADFWNAVMVDHKIIVDRDGFVANVGFDIGYLSILIAGNKHSKVGIIEHITLQVDTVNFVYGSIFISSYPIAPVDSLTSTSTTAALSANQGRILNNRLNTVENKIVVLTQSEYDAITEKDENVIYMIYEEL